MPEGSNGIELFRFKQPAKWNAIPKLQKADGDIPGGAFTGYGESLTLLNGQLYYAGALLDRGQGRRTRRPPSTWCVASVSPSRS